MLTYKTLSLLMSLQACVLVKHRALAVEGQVNVPDPILDHPPFKTEDYPAPDSNKIKNLMKTIRLKAKYYRGGEDEKKFSLHKFDITYSMLDLVDVLTSNPNNVLEFQNLNGVVEVVHRYMQSDYKPLIESALIILKTVLSVDSTAKYRTSKDVAQSLLDLYGDAYEASTHDLVLEVMLLWVPQQLDLQLSIMERGGLEFFYPVIYKHDAKVIHSLLELLNNMMKEHLAIKNKKQVPQPRVVKFYQKIKFIQQFVTKAGCVKLLKIIHKGWSYSTRDREVLIPILELFNQTKPYCLKHLKDEATYLKTLRLLKSFLLYLAEVKYSVDNVVAVHMNITECEAFLRNYIKEMRPPVPAAKDEL